MKVGVSPLPVAGGASGRGPALPVRAAWSPEPWGARRSRGAWGEERPRPPGEGACPLGGTARPLAGSRGRPAGGGSSGRGWAGPRGHWLGRRGSRPQVPASSGRGRARTTRGGALGRSGGSAPAHNRCRRRRDRARELGPEATAAAAAGPPPRPPAMAAPRALAASAPAPGKAALTHPGKAILAGGARAPRTRTLTPLRFRAGPGYRLRRASGRARPPLHGPPGVPPGPRGRGRRGPGPRAAGIVRAGEGSQRRPGPGHYPQAAWRAASKSASPSPPST